MTVVKKSNYNQYEFVLVHNGSIVIEDKNMKLYIAINTEDVPIIVEILKDLYKINDSH